MAYIHIYSDILSGIYSDILSGSYSDILSGVLSDMCSGPGVTHCIRSCSGPGVTHKRQRSGRGGRRPSPGRWGKKHMYDSLAIELCKENFLLSTGKQQIVTYIHWECIHVHIYIWVRYVNAILYICIICIYIYTHMWLFLVSSAMEFAGGSLRVGDPGYPSMNCAGWRPTGNHQKLTCHVVTLPHPNKKKYCASFSNLVRK